MNETRAGVLAMIGACTVWGLSPLYYKLLVHVPPFEVLAHRTVWSLAFFAVVLALQGRLGQLRRVLSHGRSVAVLALAGLLISANWFLFILSVQINRTTETSLGYYMFPLVAVLFGVVFFGERLGRAQTCAVALAGVAVLVLSVGLGVPPWISLILASTFGLYGVIKKRLATGAVLSVTAEVLLLSPLAIGWLWHLHSGGPQAAGLYGGDLWTSGLLMVSGPLTAIPLILFSYASQRVALTTVGLLQYINPTLQFFCAVVIFGEPFGPVHGVAFALIWAALAIYSLSSIRREKARRRALVTASAPPQV